MRLVPLRGSQTFGTLHGTSVQKLKVLCFINNVWLKTSYPCGRGRGKNKSRLKVAKVHNKISRCREDFHHKLSRRIVNENQVIVLENLAIKNMVKNHNLAKAISQVGWNQFCTMLKYKAEQEGKIYLEVDRFFPSSKTCHVCLNQIGSLPLNIRQWTCSGCNTTHDRDINAAISLRDEGLRVLASGTGATAYCPDVRLSRGGRKKSTTRQSVG
jgi:putative transposase